jgi:hypothetical protein
MRRRIRKFSSVVEKTPELGRGAGPHQTDSLAGLRPFVETDFIYVGSSG